ncbi:MAG: hypothetical protein JSU87_12805 [Gemmatimonadota bacterium]|nr:MAG: hypothetical protein JSU87_12805 [Gemmatimonadota bacterium]
MIISDKHKYVFVELPQTATTAISQELRDHYGGRVVLHKHSNYRQYLKYASPEQKKYFVFSGVRNPLDEAVTSYTKYKQDHRSNYSRKMAWVSRAKLRRFKYITERNATFSEFLFRFYRLPVENWSSLDHHRFDFVYRLENIQDDFAELIRRIGLELVRPLPILHKTKDKESWQSYYTPETRRHARFVFGPLMEQWGYGFPPDWDGGVPLSSKAIYRTVRTVKNLGRRLRPTYISPERRP